MFASFVLGYEEICIARLQASAAIALGGMDVPAAGQALLKSLQARDDGYNELYKGFAIMSLGQLGDEAAAKYMRDLLNPMLGPGAHKSRENIKSPLRGYAAVALGLYCQPVKTPQGPIDRPGWEELTRLLAERMADVKEEDEVRTAAALALGLAGRTENLRYLIPASTTIEGNNELLAGYAILARGMLGDRNVVAPAQKLLDKGNDRDDTSGLLARRAAVLGLALCGSDEALPVLVQAWHLSYFTNRETLLALSLRETYSILDDAVKLLNESPDAWERAFAARCLGEMLMPARPSRLDRILQGGNYTIRNDRLMPYQTLANEFMYLHLLPAFGKAWR